MNQKLIVAFKSLQKNIGFYQVSYDFTGLVDLYNTVFSIANESYIGFFSKKL